MIDTIEFRVVQLKKDLVVADDLTTMPMYEHVFQYKKNRGLWTSFPVIETTDEETYLRMKGGADD